MTSTLIQAAARLLKARYDAADRIVGPSLADLKARLRETIRKGLSARHVPAYIFEIHDIPVCARCHVCC